jgi:hypothetical protein
MNDVIAEQARKLRDAPKLINRLAKMYEENKLKTLIPILPMLSLKGEPYSLDHHAPFEPLFKLSVPRRTYWKTGRQVSKTTGLSAQSVLQTATQPHFATLFVAPRFEQIRRVSANYVRPFIETSLMAGLLTNKYVENSVLQKSFLNESKMFFSFAFLDVERIRGISADCIKYDEVQDVDNTFIPVIRECMSASRFGIEMFFGTPKTLDNTLQLLWDRESSQAEWVTRCRACNFENIPALDYHLLKMIGPTGPICAKCGRKIQPREGRWIHAIPSRMTTDSGYHVPQIIMPMHYEDLEHAPGVVQDEATDKWLELLGKRDGRNNYTQARFLNEVLGESCDVGIKLVTLTDIRNASRKGNEFKNEEPIALKRVHTFLYRAMGVDWGGGGEDMISWTVVTITGLDPKSGRLEVLFTKRLHAGMTHMEEVVDIMRLFKAFQCHYFCHDYGGAGAVREALMIQAGFPIEKIFPFAYVRATSRKMVEMKRPGGHNQRAYFSLDKARSLVLQALCLKALRILLPEYETSKDVTEDLLALIEDKHAVPRGADIYLITSNPKMSDDFAHSLNFSCIGIWHIHRCYPDLSRVNDIKLTPEQANFANPSVKRWD